MIDIDPKLLKIVALAKHGIGGEKEAAIRLVRRICEREGIEFDDVMSESNEFKKYDVIFKWKNKVERQIVVNCIWHFALSPEHHELGAWNYDKSFEYTTTPSKHLETVNAVDIYLKAFRKEQKKIMQDLMSAFLSKHRLFREFDLPSDKDDDDDDEPPDIDKLMRQKAIMDGMDDVEIRKQIGGGDANV